MTAQHGTQRRYVEGCRCDACKEAHRVSARQYRERRATGQTRLDVVVAVPFTGVVPGPVESGVEADIGGAAEAPPGLAQAALAMARLLDNPRAMNQQPAAAKVLATLLDKLSSGSTGGRRGGLALVRTMTEKNGG